MLLLVVAWQVACLPTNEAQAGNGWDGRRRISYQRQKDLFYDYYVGPYGCNAAAQMYVAPLPVPANVGHTYVSYQPLMPHEMMYDHNRSYYTYNPGAGWTRTNVRYRSRFNFLQDYWWRLNYPRRSLQVQALNDFTFDHRLLR